MKISIEKKKQLLLDSFELLKDDYEENQSSLHDIVGKMAKIDTDISVSMWKYLIEKNPKVLHNEGDFGYWFMDAIERAVGEEGIVKIVTADDFLKKSIYGGCGDLDSNPLYVIQWLILKDELSTASELMELVFSNKHKSNSLYHILDNIIPDEDEQITEEAFELLNSWIKKVRGKAERAKLNLKMLDFMDEDDDE